MAGAFPHVASPSNRLAGLVHMVSGQSCTQASKGMGGLCGLGPEQAQCHFYQVMLAHESHKASLHSKVGKQTLPLNRRSCKFTLLRAWVWGVGSWGHVCNLRQLVNAQFILALFLSVK